MRIVAEGFPVLPPTIQDKARGGVAELKRQTEKRTVFTCCRCHHGPEVYFAVSLLRAFRSISKRAVFRATTWEVVVLLVVTLVAAAFAMGWIRRVPPRQIPEVRKHGALPFELFGISCSFLQFGKVRLESHSLLCEYSCM